MPATMTAKRKSWIPKNIATMTDAERYKWWASLPHDVADRLSDKTFKGAPEWFVYWTDASEPGEMQGPNIHESQADAMKEFAETVADPSTIAVRVEKVVGHYSLADAGLEDREYTTIAECGTFPGESE